MKPFNSELNKDILTLKAFSIKKDKVEFCGRVKELMIKHSVSRATIYRELKKEVPGSYDRPNHSPHQRAISEKEISMVKELLLKKIPVMDIGRIMETETGNKYTWERIDKLRQIVEVRLNEPGKPLDAQFATSFGYPVKCLVEQALNLNRMAENAYVEFCAGDKTYRLTYHEARDIALICANAIVRCNEGYDNELTYLRAKLKMLFREKIRSAPVATSIKEYRDLKWQLEIYADECEADMKEFSEERRKTLRKVRYEYNKRAKKALKDQIIDSK